MRESLRNGADDDAKVFSALRAGESEIYGLHSILAQNGKPVKLECNLLHRHPQGLEPRGGTDYEARRYVPESFRAVPESNDLKKFGTQIKLDSRVDEDICTLHCQFESTLEPPLQTAIKTTPALRTERDPAAIGAVRDYRLEFGGSTKLEIGANKLLFAHRPEQFRSSPARAGMWQLTFVRVTRPFPTKQ